MKLDLLDLNIVLSISETQSLTEASKRVHLTTSAVSYRLKSLEESFDTVLFDRNQKGMIVTDAGLDFIQYAQQILTSTNTLVENLKTYKDQSSNVIRVLANSSTLQALTKRIANYLQAYPTIDIDLDEKISEKIIWNVMDDVADIGLIAGELNLRNLMSRDYGLDELVFICHPKHPIASFDQITFNEAIKYEMVALGKNSSNFLFMQELALKNQLLLRVRVYAQSFFSMIHCVKNNVGIALCPLSIVKDEIINRDLVAVKINESWSIRKQRIIFKKESMQSTQLMSFIDFLTQESIPI